MFARDVMVVYSPLVLVLAFILGIKRSWKSAFTNVLIALAGIALALLPYQIIHGADSPHPLLKVLPLHPVHINRAINLAHQGQGEIGSSLTTQIFKIISNLVDQPVQTIRTLVSDAHLFWTHPWGDQVFIATTSHPYLQPFLTLRYWLWIAIFSALPLTIIRDRKPGVNISAVWWGIALFLLAVTLFHILFFPTFKTHMTGRPKAIYLPILILLGVLSLQIIYDAIMRLALPARTLFMPQSNAALSWISRQPWYDQIKKRVKAVIPLINSRTKTLRELAKTAFDIST